MLGALLCLLDLILDMKHLIFMHMEEPWHTATSHMFLYECLHLSESLITHLCWRLSEAATNSKPVCFSAVALTCIRQRSRDGWVCRIHKPSDKRARGGTRRPPAGASHLQSKTYRISQNMQLTSSSLIRMEQVYCNATALLKRHLRKWKDFCVKDNFLNFCYARKILLLRTFFNSKILLSRFCSLKKRIFGKTIFLTPLADFFSAYLKKLSMR